MGILFKGGLLNASLQEQSFSYEFTFGHKHLKLIIQKSNNGAIKS